VSSPTGQNEEFELPDWFEDPIRNPHLPAITEWDGDEDPTPPDDRLAEEPDEVEVDAARSTVLDELAEPDEDEDLPRGRVPAGITGIDLTNYSSATDPDNLGFGPACGVRLAKVTLSGASFSVHILLAELVWLIMAANEAQGYKYRPVDTGSYNCRYIAGTQKRSRHSWAVAIDANWQSNPYTSPLRTDRPQWERDRWNRFGFAGGWDYSGDKDAMHAEAMMPVALSPQLLALARKELLPIIQGLPAKPVPKPVTPTPAPRGKPVLRRGSTGTAVRNLQAGLARIFPAYRHTCGALPATGNFLIVTECWVKQFQRASGLVADGVVGPSTWAKLARYGIE
jgi:hypothetical protein